jgi:hypothetical protein
MNPSAMNRSAEAEGRRLFVGGLSLATTDISLRAHFSTYFPVTDAQVRHGCSDLSPPCHQVKRHNDGGRSRGFGFVTFSSAAGAEPVFATQPHTIDGKAVELRRSGIGAGTSDTAAVPTESEAAVMRRLCIRSLPNALGKPDLFEYFNHCGEVEEVVVTETDGGRRACITFTRAASVEVAQRARPHTVRGSAVETKRAAPLHLEGQPETEIDSVKVFLGPPDSSHKGLHGLGEETTDQDLGLYFGQFGQVVGVKQCVWEDTGRKRGFGYVEMADCDQVGTVSL